MDASSSACRLSTACAVWLAHRQLAKGDECRLLEKILQRGARPLRRVDHATLEPVEQGARREIDHKDLVGLLDHPVRNRLAHTHAGALPDLIVQTFQVLHVHRGQHVDARVEQGVDVLPPLEPGRPRNVRVRKLVDDGDLRMPPKNRRRIHVFKARSLVLDDPSRNRFQPLDERHRVAAAVRLEIRHDSQRG